MKKMIRTALVLAVLLQAFSNSALARKPKIVENGHTVTVNYTGLLTDGRVFDTNLGHDPLEFKVGAGTMIPGFEQGVLGMEKGETKLITIPADQAYGKFDEAKIFPVAKASMPTDIEVKEGTVLNMATYGGAVVPVRVLEVDEEQVYVDANHLLAGKTLVFDVEVLKIQKEKVSKTDGKEPKKQAKS